MHVLFDHFLDLLFPPRCAGCKTRGALFCDRCRCDCQPFPAHTNHMLHRRLANAALTSTSGVYRFNGPIREAIHALKYERRVRVAAPLGDLLADYVVQQRLAVDTVVPVPLHPERARERGFNQAEVLARRVAMRLDLPPDTSLIRVRATSQQHSLNRQQRHDNVRDAFAWCAQTPAPSRVLLVDDVLTTGATIAAAAHVLRTAGAVEVHGLALARAGG